MSKSKVINRIFKELRKAIPISWYLLWGALFITIKWYKKAEKMFIRGLKYAETKNPEAKELFVVGIIDTYDLRGEKEKALELLKERIELNPQRSDFYFDLAEFYLLNDEKEPAILNYEKALEYETDQEWRSIIQRELNKLQRQ